MNGVLIIGVTPTKTLPKIYLSDDKRFKTKYGDYQNKLITVYLNTCNTKKRIIETVLHEYCHFLQMPKNSDMVKYQYYSLFYDYHYHPLELEVV
jgi:Zn-dependent peptidase ImmA (M78 family)